MKKRTGKNTPQNIPEPIPGEILLEEFLKPYGITQYKLAKDTGKPHSRVTRLIKGEVGITVDTALRLAAYFGTTPHVWLNLQSNYDIRTVSTEKKQELENIPRVTAA
jgi:addiction module HigA family antidote